LTFANTAGIAIHKYNMFYQERRRTRILRSINKIGHVITSSLNLKNILDLIVDQVIYIIKDQNRQNSLANIWLVDDQKIELISSSSKDKYAKDGEQLPKVLELWPPKGKKAGIVVKAIQERNTQTVNDVNGNSDYIATHQVTCSEIVVPIKASDQVIGVIDVECDEYGAFTEDDQVVLESLAAQAGIVIQNVRQYHSLLSTHEDLQRVQKLVSARTAVAWMGMTSSVWRHRIKTEANVIEDLVELIRRDMKFGMSTDKILDKLSDIELTAQDICKTPITAPLSSEEGTETIFINSFIQNYIRSWQDWQHLKNNITYNHINYREIIQETEGCKLRIDPEWLTNVLNILLQNAVDAMADVDTKNLEIRTHLMNSNIEVHVIDNGHGISNDIQGILFRERIFYSGHKSGDGIGLLLAQTIIQAYGGDIRLHSTGQSGTTMVVILPYVH
jgi:signal transduction histidine kinase